MPDPFLYAQSVGATALASALCLAAGWWLLMVRARRHGKFGAIRGLAVITLVAGWAAGEITLAGGPSWPPHNALDRWVTIVIPTAVLLELIGAASRLPSVVVWLVRFGLVAVVPRILWHGSVYLTSADDAWPLWKTSMAYASCTFLGVGVWWLLGHLVRRAPGMSVPCALVATILSAGLTIMLAGYLRGGAAAIPLATALLVAAVGTRLTHRALKWRWAERRQEIAEGVPGAEALAVESEAVHALVGIGVVGLFGLLFIGHFFGRLGAGSAITLLLAPLACWGSELRCPPWPGRRQDESVPESGSLLAAAAESREDDPSMLPGRVPSDRPAWVIGLLRLVLVAIPLAIVVFLAKREFDRELAPLISSVEERPADFVATGNAGPGRTVTPGELVDE